ncbi:phenylalanine--tRNA ligase subunit beta [Carnobacteriaceae bacterium zg-ZUI78]|uniref:phenylalanine--tRNA ligase subunit beta n=1 Tax=Granulicatella sp. zg-84 TaxID=2678503 RepID=UPI0013BF3DBA|nr:phenylalanine--tRNA ligase subunit beta [Granulicatella sp. zg-84]MBS4750083.1 phenylalanine--tRNA ligase subunit beta [Carnobacteriaceae bacterium zg-ZUI78]NEW66618.1 phenylalanine--tRNA ligase subunit beta [Granulicatella sp. zg-84]QMI86268.1 phenylalanine--tRNA ligase subunit beta [Carnobacteriaceae bacterium zg-84]
MLISYEWLKEYLPNLSVSPQELADKMSTTGIEIEGVSSIGETLTKIVIGKTIDVVDHPDSDHLHICQVEVGLDHAPEEQGVLQIVCGAPNVDKNQKVIVALSGARIVNNIKIKKGKIRGVASNGMLCSLEELGFPSNVIPKEVANGIFILPEDAPIGSDIVDYLGLNDSVLELSITPNRADALSMYGTAYEVGAIYDETPHIHTYNVPTDTTKQVKDYVQVSVDNPVDCPAYYMTIIKDVTIQPSPLWLQMRLMKIGVRPINNVVDATNYMLMAYGQPLHAFDYDTLPQKHIHVRKANEHETLVTLDDTTRTLTVDDIVITSGDTPVALGGVMGGLDTEITSKTTTVALETAVFNPKNIRLTSKRLNLRSESSARYEKGINLAIVKEVAHQAAALIAELSGGTVVSGYEAIDTLDVQPSRVMITTDKINHALGATLTQQEVLSIFDRLAFEYNVNGTDIDVIVPPRRWDIAIESDIIEEVARIYGYDKLPSTLPVTPAVSGRLSTMQSYVRKTRSLFEGLGYTQVIGYSLTSPEKSGLLAMAADDAISLALPMSEERSVLRRSLLSGLLDIASYNIARGNTNLSLYETGRVFYAVPDQVQPREEEHIALLLTGNKTEKTWNSKSEKITFYDLKGTLETYFEKMGVSQDIVYKPVKKENMHPGRTASIVLNGQEIGFIGQLHPSLEKAYDLPETYVCECLVLPLITYQRQALVQTEVPKYPSMTRDIALLVDKDLSHADILTVLKENAGAYLVNVHLFDYYMGDNIGLNKKSLAYRLTFMNLKATLVEEDVNKAMQQVTTALTETFNIVIR